MEKIRSRKTGHRYSAEFKARTLALIRTSGKPVAEISRELGVPKCTIRWWMTHEGSNAMPTQKGAKAVNPKERVEELERELRKLQKENKILLMERDILKRAATWFAKESE